MDSLANTSNRLQDVQAVLLCAQRLGSRHTRAGQLLIKELEDFRNNALADSVNKHQCRHILQRIKYVTAHPESNMTRTLERYQRSSYNSQDNNLSVADLETQSWYQEVSKLNAKYESLQRSQRHLLGEDLGPLSVKELQNLEKQLEGALTQARQRKTQIMIEQMEELHRKERHLGDINKQLKDKFQLEAEGHGSFRAIQGSWDNTAIVANNFSMHPSRSNAMDCEPTLQIGYHQYVSNEGGGSVPRSNVGENNFIQGWVL